MSMSIGFLLMFVFSQKTLYQGFQYSFFLFSYQLSISLLQSILSGEAGQRRCSDKRKGKYRIKTDCRTIDALLQLCDINLSAVIGAGGRLFTFREKSRFTSPYHMQKCSRCQPHLLNKVIHI